MIMLVEDDPSKKQPDTSETKSSIAELATLHCHQQHVRNERLLNQRKIKSRNAARTRRGKENFEFYELAKLLPIPLETSSQLDKASIIRLTMSFLKMREFSFCNEPTWKLPNDGPPPNRTVKDASTSVDLALHHVAVSEMVEEQMGSRILQSLDGFIFVLNCQGRFLYISETVSIFLGLSQVEMIGSSIFDYTYPDDRNELAVHLGLTLSSHSNAEKKETKRQHDHKTEEESMRSFFIRMKSTLTKRGVTPKTSCYKVVHICTRVQKPTFKHSIGKTLAGLREESDLSEDSKTTSNPPLGIIAFGSSLPPQNLIDAPLNNNFFVTRVNPSLQFTYCETNAEQLVGYEAREVVGQSLYHCVHAYDVEKIKKCHIELLTKGHVTTPYFRWLHKSGGYRWVCSTVMLLSNQRLYPEQSFIWIHAVISGMTAENKVMDMYQLPLEEVERRLILVKRSSSNSNGKPRQKKRPHKEIDSHNSGSTTNQNMDSTSKKLKDCDTQHETESTDDSAEKSMGVLALQTENDDITSSDENNNITAEENAPPSDQEPDTCQEEIVSLPGSKSIIHTPVEKKPLSVENVREASKADSAVHTPVNSAVEGCRESASDSEALAKRPQSHSDMSVESDRGGEGRRQEDIEDDTRQIVNETARDSGLKILCMAPEVARHLKQPPSAQYADSVSEYMDVDSTMWSNPPNKEISNHNDLPPGIKQMHGLMSVRRTTPSAVHHHYPFGINPALLHSNPLLAKLMAAGWGAQLPAADAFMVTAPVRMMPPYHIPGLPDHIFANRDGEVNKTCVYTPASVAAVLEELKKDPLHKVNPPNKVVLPNFCEGMFKSSIASGCKNFLYSVPHFGASHHVESEDEDVSQCREAARDESPPDEGNASKAFPRTLTALNLYPGEVLNPHVRGQTVLQVPGTILVPANGMIFNGADSSLIALNSNTGLKLPIVSAVGPCVMQPFTFPQVAKVRSVPF